MSRRWTRRERSRRETSPDTTSSSGSGSGRGGKVRSGRELAVPRRVPASMPGRIRESSAGPGRCARAFSGTEREGEGGKQKKRREVPATKRDKKIKEKKKRKESELFFFYLVCQVPPLSLSSGTHAFIVRGRVSEGGREWSRRRGAAGGRWGGRDDIYSQPQK